jgi:hypothetical protein
MTDERNGNRFHSIHQKEAQAKKDLGKDEISMQQS